MISVEKIKRLNYVVTYIRKSVLEISAHIFPVQIV